MRTPSNTLAIFLVKLFNELAFLGRLGQTLDIGIELCQTRVSWILHMSLGGTLTVDERVNGVGR